MLCIRAFSPGEMENEERNISENPKNFADEVCELRAGERAVTIQVQRPEQFQKARFGFIVASAAVLKKRCVHLRLLKPPVENVRRRTRHRSKMCLMRLPGAPGPLSSRNNFTL